MNSYTRKIYKKVSKNIQKSTHSKEYLCIILILYFIYQYCSRNTVHYKTIIVFVANLIILTLLSLFLINKENENKYNNKNNT